MQVSLTLHLNLEARRSAQVPTVSQFQSAFKDGQQTDGQTEGRRDGRNDRQQYPLTPVAAEGKNQP